MLRSVGWLRTDVSRLRIGPIFKCQAVQEEEKKNGVTLEKNNQGQRLLESDPGGNQGLAWNIVRERERVSYLLTHLALSNVLYCPAINSVFCN